MQTVTQASFGALAATASKTSSVVVAAAALIVVLAIVLVFLMVLRSNGAGKRTASGLGYDAQRGPIGQPRNDAEDPANAAWQRQAGRQGVSDGAGNFGVPGQVSAPGARGSWSQQPEYSDNFGAAPSNGAGQDRWGAQQGGGAWAGQPAAGAQQGFNQGGVAQWGAQGAGQQPQGFAGGGDQWGAQGAQGGWNGAGGVGGPAAGFGQGGPVGPVSRPGAQGGAFPWDAPAAQPGADFGAAAGMGAMGNGTGPANNGRGGWGQQPNSAPMPWDQPEANAPAAPGWGAPAAPGYGAGGPSAPMSPNGAQDWGAPQQGAWNGGQPAPAVVAPGQDGAGFDADKTRVVRPNGAQRLGMIVVREGKEPGRTFDARKERITIGRSRDSDIMLEDLAVSRLHTTILHDGSGHYLLHDEGSANGTYVNGQRVGEHPLEEGDEIQVGQTVLAFVRR